MSDVTDFKDGVYQFAGYLSGNDLTFKVEDGIYPWQKLANEFIESHELHEKRRLDNG